ncbi:MAG: single-stranded-DNA-specific exonuclease RecJ [Bacteriovoracaceae bacterium]|nr:single-stranded-DNA-specific exonuclease RecJ [Bacteriovoracaceae bacterium]
MMQTNLKSIHPVLIKLLQKRGIVDAEAMAGFFSWELKDLPELTKLHDLSKASSRIVDAIEANEEIGVYGDYDVDGTTSCALLYHFFRMIGKDVSLSQPNRFVEGYGIHPSFIDTALEKKISLIITVDCGITAHETASYAREKKCDLIITDHHRDDPDKPLPDACAVINPSRRDENPDSQLTAMAGVGVAFALALGIKKEMEKRKKTCPSIYPLLQFVAVGTICDLAPLNPMNLKLTRHGLKQMTSSGYPGIKAFISKELRKLKMVPSEHISFQMGPKINSKGRLDHPEKALELLTTDDQQIAWENCNHLENCNNERKFIQSEVYQEAKEAIEKKITNDNHIISVVYSPNWHEGVIGIVASRLVEQYKVPAIIFTNSSEDGVIKASARTAGELNIFKCLKDLSHLFIKFGGHKAAAGLSMKKENLAEFKDAIFKNLCKIPAIERTVIIDYDLELMPDEIVPSLLKNLELMEPYGNQNQRPLFKMTGLKLASYKILKEKHVRWDLHHEKDKGLNFKGISFNYIDSWECIHPSEIYDIQNRENETLAILFNLTINRWNGNEYPQLQIKKIVLGAF